MSCPFCLGVILVGVGTIYAFLCQCAISFDVLSLLHVIHSVYIRLLIPEWYIFNLFGRFAEQKMGLHALRRYTFSWQLARDFWIVIFPTWVMADFVLFAFVLYSLLSVRVHVSVGFRICVELMT